MKKLPKIVYLMRMEEGTSDEWLEAETDISQFGNDSVVGVYELKETKIRRTEHRLD